MKAKKLLLIAASAAMTLAGCASLDTYSIDAPSDLADKIAEYQAEKEAENVVPSDAVSIELSPATVGAEDLTSGWWTEFSQYFTIPVGKKLVIKFVNQAPGVENYTNWVLAVTTPYEREAAGYAEYLILRSDNYGWGNEYAANVSTLHLDIDGVTPADLGDDFWPLFRSKMAGATVEMTVDHASEGRAYIAAVSTALDGAVVTETMNVPVSFVNDINAFLVADHCYLQLESAFLSTSDYPIVPDSDPKSISITGTPESIQFDAEDPDIWGEGVATVTFEDGSSMVVDKEKLTFSEPDMTMPGTKTVVVTYSYSKKGVLSKAAAGYYNFELVAGIERLEIVTEPSRNIYYYDGNTSLDFRPYGIEFQAVFEGGATASISLDDLTVSDIELTPGEQDVTFTYTVGEQSASTTTTIELVKGSGLGVADASSAWWTYFPASDTKVSETAPFSMEGDVYSSCAVNWNSVAVILRKGDISLGANGEYAVVRIDNYGWGGAFVNEDANKESDWNWDLFKPNLTNCYVQVNVSIEGTTATVQYDVIWQNGEVHKQIYKNITVDPEDTYVSYSVDGAYFVRAL